MIWVSFRSPLQYMKVLIADGGTGGHIFPAIAVANELEKRNDVESILFTGRHMDWKAKLFHDMDMNCE